MSRRLPSYTRHKPTGQARVRISGRDHYLGLWGTPESKKKYDQIIAAYLSGTLSTEIPQRFHADSTGVPRAQAMTVAALLVCYLDHASRYYRKGGEETDQMARVGQAVKAAVERCGTLAAIAFGPRALKEVRRDMVRAGKARSYVNALVGCLVRAWGWAVSEELVPGEAAHALREVVPLRQGEDGVRESGKVGPVAWAAVEAVRSHLRPVVYDLLRAQYLAGMRPTEACHLRGCHIDREGRVPDGPTFPGVWVYVAPPEANKTHHRGKKRIVFLGPQAQELMTPYLEACGPDDYLFSPARDRPAAKGKRKPGERYTTHSLYTAVRRACKLAGVPHWHPSRLRHTKATEIRARCGLDTAGAVLGHSNLNTTLVYAMEDFTKAANVMRDVG